MEIGGILGHIWAYLWLETAIESAESLQAPFFLPGLVFFCCSRHQHLAEFKLQAGSTLSKGMSLCLKLQLQGRTVKEQLESFVADAQRRGDVYILVQGLPKTKNEKAAIVIVKPKSARLDQRFFCQQDDSPTGPLRWRRFCGIALTWHGNRR